MMWLHLAHLIFKLFLKLFKDGQIIWLDVTWLILSQQVGDAIECCPQGFVETLIQVVEERPLLLVLLLSEYLLI